MLVVPRYLPGFGTQAAPSQQAPETPDTIPFEARSAPPGFSSEALWRIPVTEGTRPAVSDDGSRVAFIGADGKLAVAGPEGKRLWEADLPIQPAEIEGAVRFVKNDDQWEVAIAGTGKLWIWSADAAAHRVQAPQGRRGHLRGHSPARHHRQEGHGPPRGRTARSQSAQGNGGHARRRGRSAPRCRRRPLVLGCPGKSPRKSRRRNPRAPMDSIG